MPTGNVGPLSWQESPVRVAHVSLHRAARVGVGGHVAAGPRWCCCRLGMDVARVAKRAFISPNRVREVHNINEDGFDSLYPRYSAGRAAGSAKRATRRWSF